MKTELDITIPDNLFRKNSIDIGCHINLDLSNYKIRAELFDRFYSALKLATVNDTNGSDEQIEIIDADKGTFVIHIAKNTATLFHLISYLEIEIEDKDGKVQTVWFAPIQFVDDIFLRSTQ